MACVDFPSTGLVPNVTTFQVDNIIYLWTGIAWESQVSGGGGGGGSGDILVFNTLEEAITSVDTEKIFEGSVLSIKERVIGGGGGAFWDVVLKSSVTISPDAPSVGDVVEFVSFPLLALQLRQNDINYVAQYGGIEKTGESTNYIIQKLNKPLDGETGGIINLPAGEIDLDEQIFVRNPLNTFNIDSLTINGAGRQSTLIDASNVNDNALEVRFGIYNHIQDFTITNAQENAIFINDSDLNNEPSVDDPYYNEWVKLQLEQTAKEEEEKEELEAAKEEELENEKKERTMQDLFSVEGLTKKLADPFEQVKMLQKMASLEKLEGYYDVVIQGGEYKDTVKLVDGSIKDNTKALRNLAQDKTHEKMVGMQYDK